MCKFESSQTEESRGQSADSSKACSKSIEQGYSNGGPRSECGPLDIEGPTSSGSQKGILFTKVSFPKI